ncbi:MAG: glutamine--tRNA ligase/YqeY domain fusion protein [Clostridia bacterium]
MDIVSSNFINEQIDRDLADGACNTPIHTRFPPEPNGYLHIGSAKAIWISAGCAQKYGGTFNLRFDDTNPVREEDEFVRSIEEDLRWLGAYPDGGVFYGSDYFSKCFEYAVTLIKKGLAYVCDLNADDMRKGRGTLTQVGTDSPYRNRSIEENLDLFARMKDGEFPDGRRTLRAKIDMSSPNMNMRDPAIYRILHMNHHRAGDAWCIYPLYDFAHPIQDALEGITHSLCSIEFEDHRPLYEWVLRSLDFSHPPRQMEFSRLNLSYTVMSKRYLRGLVEGGHVDGWDDPRMPTISGLRRRGYTPTAIRNFCDRIGVAKTYSVVDHAFLEHCIREDLNVRAARAMVVLRPIKLTITNYPAGQIETFEAENNPAGEDAGVHELPFSGNLFIEADDFMVEPVKGYRRLYPGNEVRLKYAYYVTCTGFNRDENGDICEVLAEYDPESRGGGTPDGRKVRGTIHWVSADSAVDAEVRLYDTLFTVPDPLDLPEGESFAKNLNPNSLEILAACKCEPWLKNAASSCGYQFLRNGYFCLDTKLSKPDAPVFNRTVSLKDSWVKKA